MRDWHAIAYDSPDVAQAPRPAVVPCVYGEPECRGCRNRPKVRCHSPYGEHDVVVPAVNCLDCRDRLPLGSLRIASVITAWNEGDEVAATIESLQAGVREAQLTIILVDDGSTDGSCAPSTWHLERGTLNAVQVVRHEAPLGVGRSRNAGWAHAQQFGPHVVTFHDAHMRFPEGVLERLAVQAVRRRCIVSSASHGIPSKGTLAGCRMVYDASYGLQPKWADGLPSGWQRTPCMMGAGYAIGAETARALEAPTGSLWEDTAGRWGFSEQALSVKAHLLGIPVLTNRDLALGHRYRDANPVPDAAREVWKNVARATALLFGRGIYEQRFAAWCRAHVPADELSRILADATSRRPASWPVDPETVWRECVEEHGAAASPSSTSSNVSPASTKSTPSITVCLLNWKRPQNVPVILDSIAAQNVPARVVLWDNPSTGSGQAAPEPLPRDPRIALTVHASANLGCFPRWWLASVADTEWVCSLDDDLCLAAPDALEAAVERARSEDCIVGAYGVRLLPGRPYREGVHVNLPVADTRVDIVKGRFMLFRRTLLERVPLHVPALDALGEAASCVDDVRLSLCVGVGRPRPHLLAGALRGKLKELPAPGALSARAGHYERRQRAVELLRAHLERNRR